YSGNQVSSIGMYSHLLSLLLLTPFCFILIKLTRDNQGGIIGGKEALRVALRFVFVSAIFLSVFNYIFFEAAMGEFMVNYIRSIGPGKMKEDMLKAKKAITDAEIQKQIELAVSQLSAFKDTTFKLLSIIAFGLFSSFISAVFLRRKASA
ncbi:MAG: DUF4199 domain-containing protein, partial [Bacteroidia bacterium]